MAKLKSYSRKQLKVIKNYWGELEEQRNTYYDTVAFLERRMADETGIKDIEFFKGEGQGFVGVGNAGRTYKLWQPKY